MAGPKRRTEILDALRRGTVPREGLAAFAVGMEKFEDAINAELAAVVLGRGGFKAVRGEYGSGKTFFARWLQERARTSGGFATSEVQVSETETPLHRWETVYRRLAERLATADTPDGALRSVVDGWFYTLEEDVLASGKIDPDDAQGLLAATDARGWHLLAILARLERLAGRRLQRIGFSATVGNPDDLLAWLSRDRGGRIVGSSAGPPIVMSWLIMWAPLLMRLRFYLAFTGGAPTHIFRQPRPS